MDYFDELSSFGCLYEAHKKCRLGKQGQPAVVNFEINLAFELTRLEKELKNYTYRLQGYHHFTIYDPKRREIQALYYRDRVVQHSLCDNALRPLLEPQLIYDNSACRQGKGTHFAMNRLSSFMRDYNKYHGTEGYILKFDIRKYFDNIHHGVLYQMLKRKIEDKRLLGLLAMIIKSYPEKNESVCGIPMGNQSSQWFAIYYLNQMDHYIKENLRIKYYTRYMDDGIMIHHDKEYLRQCLFELKKYIKEKLYLEFNEKTQIMPLKQGVDYLGFHFYLTDTGKVIRRLRTSSKKRLKRKLKHFKHAYRENKIDTNAITRSLNSYQGHLKHGNTYYFRKKLYQNFILTKSKNKQEET